MKHVMYTYKLVKELGPPLLAYKTRPSDRMAESQSDEKNGVQQYPHRESGYIDRFQPFKNYAAEKTLKLQHSLLFIKQKTA